MSDAKSSPLHTLMLLLAILMWSSNFILGRALAGAIGPFTLACLRWSLAWLCLAPFALGALRRHWPLVRLQWPRLLFLGLTGIALTNTLLYLALRSTTATNAVVLNSATPVLVLLFGALQARQRLRPLQIAGMVLALSGALTIVLCGRWGALATLVPAPGDIGVLAAAVSWACYTVALRRQPPGLPLTLQMLLLFSVGVVALLPLAASEWLGGSALPAMDAGAWLALGYLGVFPSVLAFLLYHRALAVVGSAHAASCLYLMPVFGAVLSIVFLGEQVQAFHLSGLVAIFAGVLLGSLTLPRGLSWPGAGRNLAR